MKHGHFKVVYIRIPKESQQHESFLQLPQHVLAIEGVESAQFRWNGNSDELEIHYQEDQMTTDQLVKKIDWKTAYYRTDIGFKALKN